MKEDDIHKLDGLEGIFDLVVSGEDQIEPDADRLLFQAIEKRYEKNDLIGEGGMKSIYSNFDAYCHRSIARAELKSSDVPIGKFINEARILSRLEHSNIVPLYDLGLDEENEPYFTMRLLGGQDLQELIDKIRLQPIESQIDLQQRLEIFLKVCDAVSYAHSCGVVHLDLKPANIQVEEFGEVLVCDWGLAKYLKGREPVEDLPELPEITDNQSVDGEIKGSPGYMAPEQVDKKMGERDERTDIYSLGAVLYALLTHYSPIECKSVSSMIKRTLEGDFPEPRLRNESVFVPKSLNAVILKAMAIHSSQRYQSVQDLADDVRAYKNGYATRAEQAGFMTVVSLLVKRYKLVFCSVLVSLVLLAITVLVFMVRLKEEKLHVEEALQRSEFAEASAKKSEANALDLVGRLEAEEQEQLTLRRAVIPKLLLYNRTRQVTGSFKEAAYMSYNIYNMDRDNQNALIDYLYSLFGQMRFKGFLRALGGKEVDYLKEGGFLVEQAERFVDKAPTLEEFVELIEMIQKKAPLPRKELDTHLIYSFTQNRPLNERRQLVHQILGEDNEHIEWVQKAEFYHLSLKGNTELEDLSILRNLPLLSLDLSGTKVIDLDPLQHMPLNKLNISGTRIVEVSKLNTSKLRELDIRGTKITDLFFLRNAPLQVLKLNDVKHSLAYLRRFKELELLVLSRRDYSSKDLEYLPSNVKVIFE